MTREDPKLGIYEKALPRRHSWQEHIEFARRLGFSFIEMSIDESDDRLARLDWEAAQRNSFVNQLSSAAFRIPTMCFSGHRRFPLGSHDPEIRRISRSLMRKAVTLAADIGIRVIQIAGYDVYYERSDEQTRAWFLQGLEEALGHAAREQVMLAVEIMDTPYINSITAYRKLKEQLRSAWFTLYPDIGNLTAWGNDIEQQLGLGSDDIVAIHLKDTLAVTSNHPGTFRDVPFGEGCVDFTGLFRILTRLNYRGPFVLEMWTEKSPDPEAEIARAKQWMIEQMIEGGFPCRQHLAADHRTVSPGA